MKIFSGRTMMFRQCFLSLALLGLLGVSASAGWRAFADSAWMAIQAESPDEPTASSVPGRTGNILIGRSINLSGATIRGNLAAGGSVRGEGCRIGGNVMAGGDVALKNCGTPSQLMAGRNILLENTPVQGDVILGGPNATLTRSTVGTVRFSNDLNHTSYAASHVASRSGSIVANGESRVQVGSRGVSMVNGYVITGAGDHTTLITPGGRTVYVNRRKVSGAGPSDYADFLGRTPGAPRISGPGWPDANEKRSIADSNMPRGDRRLILQADSIVQGDVVFEGSRGRVMCQDGAVVRGEIINGDRVKGFED